MKEDHRTRKQLIIGIINHRAFGYMLMPYLVDFELDKTYHSINNTVTAENINSIGHDLGEKEISIIKIIDGYSEKNLIKIFSKTKINKVFYDSLSEELLKKRIRPFIEKRMAQCLELLVGEDIPVYIKDKKYNSIHSGDELKLQEKPAQPLFNFVLNESSFLYSLGLTVGGEELKLTGQKGFILTGLPCHVVVGHRIFKVEEIDGKKLLPFFNKEFIAVPKTSLKKYMESFVYNAVKKYPVRAVGFDILTENPGQKLVLSLEPDLSDNMVLFPRFYYGSYAFKPGSPDQNRVFLEENQGSFVFRKIERDPSWESLQMQIAREMGLEWINKTFFHLPAYNETDKYQRFYDLIAWIRDHKVALAQKSIFISQDKARKKYFEEKIELSIQVKEKTDWFDILAEVCFGGYKVPFVKLRRYILSGEREYVLPDGQIAIIPEEWFSTYYDLHELGKGERDIIKFKKFHFHLLDKKIQGIDRGRLGQVARDTARFEENPETPKGLKADLRSYQLAGYSWFLSLKEKGFGGCLADDMGLGKTLQTLTLLQQLKETTRENVPVLQEKGSKTVQLSLFDQPEGPSMPKKQSPVSLVVMPTSLVHNWENEIRRFTPDLKVYKHIGMNRARKLEELNGFDVVLTTYGIVRNDIELLGGYPFFYLILDESQLIKNPGSKIYKAIIKLRAKHRLVLTGTPIENSLSDLWAQMNFINPGILGSRKFFRDKFIYPIEKENAEHAREKLQAIIHPFILRRTKQRVAKDLPPLTRQVIYTVMSEEQAKIYESEKSKIRNAILDNIMSEGMEKSSILILKGLNTLRQLANHPSMVEGEYGQVASGKFEEIIFNLDNLISEGNKVLFFSSYVKHLNLFATRFKEQGIPFSMLTGQTTNREKAINEFRDDPDRSVFLISIKAGGFGLNLTMADYVFILDPWWNPAVEEQAINRAHRIGQDKKVFVYRFLAKDTIEEKIHHLQQKKSKLAQQFIHSNNPFKGIDAQQIEDLLA